MSLEFLMDYVVVVIVGICLCIGYIIKEVIPDDRINKYIPLIMGLIGLLLNVWIKTSITPDVILGGLFSGLASTGLYEAFDNLINKKEGD